MRLFEIHNLNEGNTKQDLADVVKHSDNTRLLTRVAAYLKNQLSAQNIDQPVNEESVDNIRNSILQMLDQIDDADELQKILGVMRRDEIQTGVKELFASKGIGVGKANDEYLANLILSANSTFEEKLAFIEKAKVGYFEGTDILKNKNGNLLSLISQPDTVLKQIIGPLSKFAGKIGYPGDTGPAEMAMLLLGNKIGFPSKGDLDIAGTEVEVKASQRNKGKLAGGRPKGRNGWNSPTTIKPWFFSTLKKMGATKKELSQPLNLNTSGFNNLNVILDRVSDKNKTIGFMNELFKLMYSEITDSQLEIMHSSITDSGTLDVADFMFSWAKIQSSYYSQQEGHDVMMIINTDSLNYVLIDSPEDIDLHRGTLRFASHPSWNDNQSMSTMQFIVT